MHFQDSSIDFSNPTSSLFNQAVTANSRNTTTRAFASNASSSQQQKGNWNGTFASLAAATIGVTSMATMTLCEKNQQDPNTQYAKSGSYIQATSPEHLLSEAASDVTKEEKRLEAAASKAKKHGGGLKLFSGNGNLALSMEIARTLGINLGKATVGQFADGEVNIQIHENVRGKDVYVIQPTCPPVNNNLMELLLMVSTLNRASARRITVVIPYYGYARQDRKMQVSYAKKPYDFSGKTVYVCGLNSPNNHDMVS